MGELLVQKIKEHNKKHEIFTCTMAGFLHNMTELEMQYIPKKAKIAKIRLHLTSYGLVNSCQKEVLVNIFCINRASAIISVSGYNDYIIFPVVQLCEVSGTLCPSKIDTVMLQAELAYNMTLAASDRLDKIKQHWYKVLCKEYMYQTNDKNEQGIYSTVIHEKEKKEENTLW